MEASSRAKSNAVRALLYAPWRKEARIVPRMIFPDVVRGKATSANGMA